MEHKFTLGEYAEQIRWKLVRPYREETTDAHFSFCPHAKLIGDRVPQYRSDGSVWAHKQDYELPEVAICFNEAGYNQTVLCLKCLDEARAADSADGEQQC